MRAVKEQPMKSTSEYKEDELMEKSTAQQFGIRKRVEISHCINPIEPPRSTVALNYMVGVDTPSYTDTPMASAITSPMAA